MIALLWLLCYDFTKYLLLAQEKEGYCMEKTVLRIRQEMDRLLQTKDRVVVAIDGSCTAGKSTLAALLEREYDCNLFHMDDFFLRPEQRTPQRFAEPGGNVDYERFRQEVLLPLEEEKDFSYRPYDCSTGKLKDPVEVTPKRVNIVEGTYSQHPYFGDVYDLKVFLKVDHQVRRQRILARPAFLHQRFFEEWIPMEQAYFRAFGMEEKCDILAMPEENEG